MRKSFFLIFLWLFTFKGVCQEFSSEVWHDGFLVTSDQDTLQGLLKYDMESNIVQVIQNQIVKTYSSHKVFYFEIYDKIVSSYRQFYSIPYNVNYNYKIPILFEVLYEGPLSLLSREAVVQETVSNSSAYWGGSFVRDVVNYTFYFLDKQGNIDSYTGKKADLLAIMTKHERDVKDYIKKNKLKTDEIRDLIRITAFYNSL
ncbi:hypothetical protein [Marinoscillum sp.]|uniref:hypothetical protein n=1 Tax=Marinoscillum sp. TaxID=2024838 RepID=UPI003BAC998B